MASPYLLISMLFVVVVVATSAAVEEEKGRKVSPPGLDCERSRFSLDCLKLDLVTFLENMSEAREYKIGGGLSIVQDATIVNRTKNADIVAGE